MNGQHWLKEFHFTKKGNEYKLVGNITEYCELDGIFKSDEEILYLDMSSIFRANSSGVRDWINAVNDFPGEVIFQKCPVNIVDQFNMVPEFIGPRSYVQSFFFLYYCPECNKEQELLLTLGVNFDPEDREIPESLKCPNCQGEMEADLDEEEYLAFVKDFIDHPRLKDAVNKSYERVHERFIFRAQFLRAKLDFTEDTQMDLPEEELPIVAMIENISEGGMFICTDLPFVKNEILKIEVSIPDGKLNHMINCKVAVKWVRKANEEHNSLPGIGLQFQGLDDISKEKIKNYISSLTNGE